MVVGGDQMAAYVDRRLRLLAASPELEAPILLIVVVPRARVGRLALVDEKRAGWSEVGLVISALPAR